MKATWYEVLGVAPVATGAELRRAYLEQARRHHPDTGGDPREMTRLNEAWAVLSDPVRRRVYDLEVGVREVGARPPPGRQHDHDHERVPFDADPFDLLDHRPLSAPPREGSLPLLPPALFAVSVLVGCLSLVFDSPPMLGFAVVLFFLSCVAIAAVAMWTLRSTVRR